MMIHYIKNQIITLNIDLFLVDLGGHVESDVTPWLELRHDRSGCRVHDGEAPQQGQFWCIETDIFEKEGQYHSACS